MINHNLDMLFVTGKKLSEIIIDNEYEVVLDANALLNLYRYKQVTSKKILKVLEKLNLDNKLKFSFQSVSEFIKNRPTVILQSIDEVDNEISRIGKLQVSKLEKLTPLIGLNESDEEYFKTRKKLIEFQNQYKESLTEISDKLRSLFIDDPILDSIRKLITKDSLILIYDDNHVKETNIEGQDRFSKEIPPGNKDNNKDSNKYGDYFIWKDILTLKSDVIFISYETKTDWIIRDKSKKILSPRLELISEFKESSDGKMFTISTFHDLIPLLVTETDEEIMDDLQKKDEYFYKIEYELFGEPEKVNFQVDMLVDVFQTIIKEYNLTYEDLKNIDIIARKYHDEDKKNITYFDSPKYLVTSTEELVIGTRLNKDAKIKYIYQLLDIVNLSHDTFKYTFNEE